MKNRRNYLAVLVAVFIFSACEKVIDIPLDEADQRYVVEGVFKDNPGNNYLLLSKTGSVYESNNFEKITDATVKVTDKNGVEYVLNHVTGEPGKYVHPTLQVEPNNFYTLSIVVGDQTMGATCETFFKPELDSLTYLEQIGTFGFGEDTTYLVFFNFVDNPNQENFYRITAWVNGDRDNFYYVSNDELFSGQTYTQPLFASTVEKGDTVLVELQSMNKSNYTYFFSLSNASAEGPFSPTPSNPVSNITGNAIGYFGAYTTDTLSIIIPL